MNKQRVIWAAILIPVVVVLLWIKPLFYLLNSVIIVFFVNEFLLMNNVKNSMIPLIISFFAPLFLLKNWGIEYFISALYIIVIYALVHIKVKNATKYTTSAFFAVVYAAVLSFLSLILKSKRGAFLLLNMFIVIWLADTAAYYIGSKWGRHKLMERISPNKTIEGAIASFLTAIAVEIFLVRILGIQITAMSAVFWGFAISIFSQTGDLVESMFKRNAGVKDSSHLIPGHGGIMDRLDSLLFTAPLYFVLLKIFL